MGSNGKNHWPISAVASTTNDRPQRSQPPFRSAFLGQFSLPTCVYEKNRAVRVVGHVFPWRNSLPPTYGSETRGFCLHGRDLASDCLGYFVKRPRKNMRTQQICVLTNWQVSTTGSSSHSDSHTPYEVFLNKFLWPMCWSFGIWLEWGSDLRTFKLTAPLENLVLSRVRRVVGDDCVETLRVVFY